MILGTAGHVDHGKTALVKALTGVDTDRLAEERRRGLTIELGFAPLTLPSGRAVSVVDVPGHEKFIPTMLSGCAGMDLALFVIAADQGPMPQTREHLAILSLLGVKGGVVALTRADLGEKPGIREQITTLVKGTFLEGAPMIPVSAVTGQGLTELRAALVAQADALPPSTLTDSPRLHIDRVFSVAGSGTVVTGTLTGGALRSGMELRLWPGDALAKVRGLECHGTKAAQLPPGVRAAVNLAGIRAEDVQRGMTLAPSNALELTDQMDVSLTLLPDASYPVKNNSRLHLHHGAQAVVCRCVLLGRDKLEPGEAGFAQLRLEHPLAVLEGDRFVVRFFSPLATLGGGAVLEAHPPRRGRKDPDRLAGLTVRASGDPQAIAAQRLAEAGDRPICPKDPTPYRAIGAPEGEGWFLSASALETYRTRALELQKQGLDLPAIRDRLFPTLPRSAAEGFSALLKLPASTRTVSPLERELEAFYRRAGLCPQEDKAVENSFPGRAAELKPARRALTDRGVLVVVCKGSRMHADCLKEGLDKLKGRFGTEVFPLAQARDALGVSRKYALMLLEYWDKNGTTKQAGEGRRFA